MSRSYPFSADDPSQQNSLIQASQQNHGRQSERTKEKYAKRKWHNKMKKSEGSLDRSTPFNFNDANFEPSGLLLQESNVKGGVVVKYVEPEDAAHPKDRWRFYVYKGDSNNELKTLHLHRSSCFLVGKEPRIAEILLVHPTISKQHAAVQFRKTPKHKQALPYIIDLESTNGTRLNGEKLEARRFYELRHGDSLRFGYSSRELLLVQESKADDVPQMSYAEFAQQKIEAKGGQL